MVDSVNRPKVFFSHSSIDKPFINRLNEDLKKCRIDTWLDTEEIRDGQPWLKAIFEGGIPTCDAVLVYLTENALKSKMVEKELDAAILHQLDDGGVAVLPYVSTADVRDQLRHDLRTRHCRVWNEQNYQEILPSVVAEICRSYLERRVATAVSKEKVRRLELELENQKLKQVQEQTVFTRQEDVDFQYIYQALGKGIEIRAEFGVPAADLPKLQALGRPMRDVFEASPLEILLHRLDAGNVTVRHYGLVDTIRDLLKKAGYSPDAPNATVYLDVADLQAWVLTFQTFGLLTTEPVGPTVIGYDRDEYGYTEKLFRFRYWLIYNNLYPTSANLKYIGRITKDNAEQDGSST
jgi:hypothetical protein